MIKSESVEEETQGHKMNSVEESSYKLRVGAERQRNPGGNGKAVKLQDRTQMTDKVREAQKGLRKEATGLIRQLLGGRRKGNREGSNRGRGANAVVIRELPSGETLESKASSRGRKKAP